MTELQNIALVYESMYVESTSNPFTNDFNSLPETCPYGFWVKPGGEFLFMLEPHHGIYIETELDEMPNGQEISDRFGYDTYGPAFKVFKWVRVVRGPGNILYYASTSKDLVSKRAMATIRDLAMIYDRVPKWAPDPMWHPPGASESEPGVPFLG